MVTPERCHPLSRLSLTRTGSETAVRQLLCPEAVKAKWILSYEKSTLHRGRQWLKLLRDRSSWYPEF